MRKSERLEEIRTRHRHWTATIEDVQWLISEAEKLRGRLEEVTDVVKPEAVLVVATLRQKFAKWEREDRGEDVSEHAGD